MLRLSRYLLLALATLTAAPLGAQTTVDSLRAEVAALREILGPVASGAIPCEALDANRPPELESGQYPATFRLKQIGCAIDYAISQVGIFTQRLALAESRIGTTIVAPPPSTVITSPDFPGISVLANEAGSFRLRSNLNHAPTQGGITDSYAGRIGINGWDGGYRILQNWDHEGTGRLPFGTIGMDSRAALSYNFYPAAFGGEHPDEGPASIYSDPNHPQFAAYHGQTLIIDGGSQTPNDYTSGAPLSHSRSVLIAAQRAGWPLFFAVSPERPNRTPQNRVVMKFNSDGSPDPVEVVLGGALRRLRACNIGGENVVCYH